jgi:hypothetical protein
MELNKRLEEIELRRELLGKYTGLLMVMYSDKTIDKEFYKKELSFIYNKLLTVSGVDSEDTQYLKGEIDRII